MQSRVGFFHFYLLHSFTGVGPGGLAPHARRGVAPRVGASPAPGTTNGGDGKGRCDLCLTTRLGVGNVYARR